MNWPEFIEQCAALTLDAAIWVFLARMIGRALRGFARG